MSPSNAEEEHAFVRVQETPDGFVLHCGCGWTSPADPAAERVGTAWDVHLSELE